ncbi:inositol 1,4,5-trisphosphate receptor type 3 [Lingula anatina]|uniref:Inositol 1,4,5-trisphosphate receptor n=1 Tax=Lingula anatina TaxID=7574 RepID=A0A2R2MJR0_LINAN|nr:inositol 1,4,5-trisphosphate receptor type 3 [Lingula anatina]|eukprot:XP_023930445.1 inositol 1,4,5-trisphosphate receptor type 3 [Lingula anatina]
MPKGRKSQKIEKVFESDSEHTEKEIERPEVSEPELIQSEGVASNKEDKNYSTEESGEFENEGSGQQIPGELRHVFTNKFIHVSSTQTSRTETSNMKVDLLSYNAKHAEYRIMPRYKVKSEGDIVQVEDQIVLESVKTAGQYLSVSRSHFSANHVYSGCHELNLSVRHSGFTVYRHLKPGPENEDRLLPGAPIQLFHKDIEAYLVAEGSFDEALVEDVHLRVRQLNQNNPRTLYPSSSALTYWQVEAAESVIKGGVLKWEQQCRLKHMVTRKYLTVDSNMKVTLTSDTDRRTIFRLHPVIKEADSIDYGTYCRIEQVVTGYWLHAEPDEYVRQDDRVGSQGDDTSMEGLKWTLASLRKVSVEKEMQYNDAFTIQKVAPDLVENFNCMAGMVPFLQNLIKQKKAGQNLTAKQAQDIKASLKEMSNFMFLNSEPSKKRQKLLRNLRIVELLVKVLLIPYVGSNDKRYLIDIFIEAYDVMRAYLVGDSRKNELYIAKHIPFFLDRIEQSQHTRDSHEEMVSLHAAYMVTELIRDNRKIVDRMTTAHIDKFMNLLKTKKNYRYLELLSVLCVCNNIAIPKNQTYITDVWLKDNQKNCVYLTEMGENIKQEPGVVYVKVDHRSQWVKLLDFAKKYEAEMKAKSAAQDINEALDTISLASERPGSQLLNVPGRSGSQMGRVGAARGAQSKGIVKQKSSVEEEYRYLEHQLDLFENLCHGRNEVAIKTITQFVTWQQVYSCLQDKELPDALKAIYVSLIIVLFVDIGENISVLDHVTLTFAFEDIHDSTPRTDRNMSGGATVPRDPTTEQVFPHLKIWIELFLQQNTDMTASEIGHNQLVMQVLRLIYHLVKYSFYEKLSDIKKLLGPLLSLLDGTNDKPDLETTGKTVEEMKALQWYRQHGRYKENAQTKAVVDAKHQAMQVMDLFFNLRFNIRLERFVQMFKVVHKQVHGTALGSGQDTWAALAPLLEGEFDITNDQDPRVDSTMKVALRELEAMFEESAFFRYAFEDFEELRGKSLKDLLLDLSHYEYDKMVTQSLYLLTRYFSAHDNLFKRAVQAQVVITDNSVRVLRDLQSKLPLMRRLIHSKMNDAQIQTMCSILDQLKEYCCLPEDPAQPHGINQDILYNQAILEDMFDILAKEFDVSLVEQYRGLQQVFQKALGLLTVMARGNASVQERLFNRLDVLLNVKGAEQELGEALAEVFTGNKMTCMRIMPHQVKRVMELVAQHHLDVPQFLDLLNAVVKVEELDLPLKRNQGYVMKYFMEYRTDVAAIVDKHKDRCVALLTGERNKEMIYLLALVDLLATCSEGENRFIESICQTIFSVNELLDIITDPKINNHRRRPYLRFLLWVYVNTASSLIEIGAGDLPHDKRVWDFMKNLTLEMEKVTEYVKENQTKAKHQLELGPSRKDEFVEYYHGTLHYFIEAVFPFLQIFFRQVYAPEPEDEKHQQEPEIVDKLATALVAFVDVLGGLMSNEIHLQRMIACASAVLPMSTVDPEVMREFQEQYGAGASGSKVQNKAKENYIREYQGEEDLNIQLNIFAQNFSMVYGGFNDVKSQIGFPSDEDYTDVGGDEELPLGNEFQMMVKCFENTQEDLQPAQRYILTSKLLEQLRISSKSTLSMESERMAQEVLDVKCLQIMRALIHNQVVKLPQDWQSNFHKRKVKRSIQRLHDVQTALNDFETPHITMSLLAKPGDNIIKEVLSLLGLLLFGSISNVQPSIADYFTGTREEKFFLAVRERMQMSAINYREKRALIAQHQASQEHKIEQFKTLLRATRVGTQVMNIVQASNAFRSKLSMQSTGKKKRVTSAAKLKGRYSSQSRLGSRTSLNRSPSLMGSTAAMLAGSKMNKGLLPPIEGANGVELKQMKKKDDKQPLLTGSGNKVGPVGVELKVEDFDDNELEALAKEVGIEGATDLDYKDEGYITLVLKVLGAMCDGQFADLQDYLREQPDNIKTVNLVGEVTKFLGLVYSSITSEHIKLVTALFNTLVEMTSGNVTNQAVVFDNKVCDYINFILRADHSKSITVEEDFELADCIVNLILAMIEENHGSTVGEFGAKRVAGIAKDAVESLDTESIFKMVVKYYTMSLDEERFEEEEERKKYEELGCKYFHTLLRMEDLDKTIHPQRPPVEKEVIRTDEDRAAWQFYKEGTMSIEIVKNDMLQKVYFRVKNQKVLRGEIKEKFKYEVDRSSPTNKLRDFLAWSQEIRKDINYQKRIYDNPLARFFVMFWTPANYSIILMSFFFAIFTLVTWVETGAHILNQNTSDVIDDPTPKYRYPYSEVGLYVLGGLHNLLALYILVSFFISNKPVFPRWCRPRSDDDEEDESDTSKSGAKEESKLAVRFFSSKTFYYIIFFVLSVLGTVFYGYTFSFHLLHIAANNQLLARVMQAVTKNGMSLILVGLLMAIIFYIYALICFGFFRHLFDNANGLFCSTVGECFVTILHRGLIISLFEVLENPDVIGDKTFAYFAVKSLLDLSFFIIITTIGLNIVFGIIVDTFSELRNSKWEIDNDMTTVCFICSRSSYDFEHQASGFECHVKKEHNQYAYLFFFIHLHEKQRNDYTSLELYVWKKYVEEDLTFFPTNRALSLQQEENRNEAILEQMQAQVTYIVSKMQEEEANKQRLIEKKQQQQFLQQEKAEVRRTEEL